MPTFRTDFPWNDEEPDILYTHGHLPHRSQRGKMYAVTFRLADSIPQQTLNVYLENVSNLPADPVIAEERLRELRAHLHNVLDNGHGSCLLRQPDIRRHVYDAILHHDGRTCDIHACVVMPNHAHLLLELYPGYHITQVVGSMKRYSAVRINKELGRTGPLWQREIFDRLVRSYSHYVHAVRYIFNNPRYFHSTEFTLYLRPDVRELVQ